MLSKHIFAAFLSLALSSYAVEAVPGNHGGFNQFKPGQFGAKPVKNSSAGASASTSVASNLGTCAVSTDSPIPRVRPDLSSP